MELGHVLHSLLQAKSGLRPWGGGTVNVLACEVNFRGQQAPLWAISPETKARGSLIPSLVFPKDPSSDLYSWKSSPGTQLLLPTQKMWLELAVVNQWAAKKKKKAFPKATVGFRQFKHNVQKGRTWYPSSQSTTF